VLELEHMTFVSVKFDSMLEIWQRVIVKVPNVPRDTIGSIVCKLKVKGTGWQVHKNPRVTAKDLQQDLWQQALRFLLTQ